MFLKKITSFEQRECYLRLLKLKSRLLANESEALLLEANLIKKHKPKFIFYLKTINHFLSYLLRERAMAKSNEHRGKKEREGFYFGPFASAGTANWTIKMLQKYFS